METVSLMVYPSFSKISGKLCTFDVTSSDMVAFFHDFTIRKFRRKQENLTSKLDFSQSFTKNRFFTSEEKYFSQNVQGM